jgi:hypothetical protein
VPDKILVPKEKLELPAAYSDQTLKPDKIEEPLKNAVMRIGNFDGIPIGHQALFHALIEKADAIGGHDLRAFEISATSRFVRGHPGEMHGEAQVGLGPQQRRGIIGHPLPIAEIIGLRALTRAQ